LLLRENFNKNKSTIKFNKVLIYYIVGFSESEVAIIVHDTKAFGYLINPVNISDFIEIFKHLDQN
jgi:hypothetical protein